MFLVFLACFSISFSNRNFPLLLVFRTRDSSGRGELFREAHSRSTTGLELHLGGFLILRKFCKIFEFDPLCHVTTLDHNITTLKEAKILSLCHVATLADLILDHPSLLRRDVGLNVTTSDFNKLRNAATLDFNVATLA